MTFISPYQAHVMQLHMLVHSPNTLTKNGYIIHPLSDEELSLKKRCVGCSKTMQQLRNKRPQKHESTSQPTTTDNTLANITSSQLTIQGNLTSAYNQQMPAKAGESEPPKFPCRYHPGQVVQKVWTCCGRNAAAEPCGGAVMHIPQTITTDALIQMYQFHFTPPGIYPQRRPRAAVALDCEMGTAVSGDSEPIRVTLIDYFTGEILVNNIINPDVPMRHLNTKYSGVTWQDMNQARRRRTCLWGNAGTREALWKHIGPETIVVGHGAHNDLRVLRWIHRYVVDSFIIESARAKRAELRKAAEMASADEGGVDLRGDDGGIELNPSSPIATRITESSIAEAPKVQKVRKPGRFSLRSLTKLRLSRDIQTGGNKGHDSLEDAIAARDLVRWSIENPDDEVSC